MRLVENGSRRNQAALEGSSRAHERHVTYKEVLAKQKISGVKFADGKSVRSQLDAVLKKGDRLVMVHTTRDGRESSGNVLMVGIRDRAPKVIGYGDARYFPSLAPSEK